MNKNYSDGLLVKCQLLDNDNNSINLIAGEVSGLDLNDESSKSEFAERGRKPRKSAANMSNTSAVEETETQGDQLNRIKAQRRNARSATSGTVTTIPVIIDDLRSYRRSASQPKVDAYISPLKSLKQPTKATTVSIYNTRAAIRKGKTITIETQEEKSSTTIENEAGDGVCRVKCLKKFNEYNSAKSHASHPVLSHQPIGKTYDLLNLLNYRFI